MISDTHDSGQPLVTLIVAMRNEERFVGATLDSLALQTYPPERLEILIVDGMSTDDSVAIASKFCAGRSLSRVLDNPRIYTACAWNVGLRNAVGEVVGIVSGHCRLAPDYVAQGVETLLRTKAELVGGPMVAIGDGIVGRGVALATGSPFGVGDAQFHYVKKESPVDTVFQGICWKSLYDNIGYFDEEMHCNEDDELSFRILAADGTIVCNPAIESEYTCRGSISGLWRQYFRYGFWKVRLMRKNSSQMRVRHFVPGVFAGAAVLLPFVGLIWSPAKIIWISLLLLYMICGCVATLLLAKKKQDGALFLVPIIFATMHMGYGVGFLMALGKHMVRGIGDAE